MNKALFVPVSGALLGLAVSQQPPARAAAPAGREYHVAVRGDDGHDGSPGEPLHTIGEAARRAQPGDVVTVHAGVYRERVDPLRGGSSDDRRIVYRAAPGERVVLKGSEVVTGWDKVANDAWEVTIPNALFGGFNPFADEIHGDWFDPRGRAHHTGAVYVAEHWLTEAAALEHVLQPIGQITAAYGGGDPYLLNVAWLRPAKAPDGTGRIAAKDFAAQQGVQTAACSEGGECIGWIEPGDWVRYEGVDLGAGGTDLELRVASATRGGTIEVRRDGPDGALLGSCIVRPTGGWQRWTTVRTELAPMAGAEAVCLVFGPPPATASADTDLRLWYARVDEATTTVWAQFGDIDPNAGQVEVNVRRAVFYPSRPGVDFLTVRGFVLMHAATPWAPPTAEQVGLVGTHWSRGWIIEDNDIRYSACTGVTLGKHGDEFDNTSQNSAEGYVETIERALARGWSKANIGHHVVRNNRIAHCEQAGIVGSMGAAFCTVTDNVIHDVHTRRLFGGAEMAAIKFHGAIDTVVARNHIYRCNRGIWLDWMAQGTRVSRNLVHDVGPAEDLFVEVNHGPFLVDHNLFLSPRAILVNSQGGAYAHNLIAGSVAVIHGERRQTPWHRAHSTEVAGLHGNPSGDDRYYNNVFVGGGLAAYDAAHLPVFLAGNVFVGGAVPCGHEVEPLVDSTARARPELTARDGGLYLRFALDRAWAGAARRLVTTGRLGEAAVPDLPYERPDGGAYALETDYLGRVRQRDNPFPGPFTVGGGDTDEIRVWPLP